MGTVDWMSVGQFLISAVPVWLLGALIGLLLPRPRWLSFSSVKTSAFFATAEVAARLSIFGRLAMCFHGFMLIRGLWFRFTSPGTFRRCCYALSQLLQGQGWNYPPNVDIVESEVSTEEIKDADSVQWCVGEADLTFFRDRTQDAGVTAGPWEKILEKEIPGQLKYVAWRRSLNTRKTEYKSITITADATPKEVCFRPPTRFCAYPTHPALAHIPLPVFPSHKVHTYEHVGMRFVCFRGFVRIC